MPPVQFLISVEAGLISNIIFYIICKWLDGNGKSR